MVEINLLKVLIKLAVITPLDLSTSRVSQRPFCNVKIGFVEFVVVLFRFFVLLLNWVDVLWAGVILLHLTWLPCGQVCLLFFWSTYCSDPFPLIWRRHFWRFRPVSFPPVSKLWNPDVFLSSLVTSRSRKKLRGKSWRAPDIWRRLRWYPELSIVVLNWLVPVNEGSVSGFSEAFHVLSCPRPVPHSRKFCLFSIRSWGADTPASKRLSQLVFISCCVYFCQCVFHFELYWGILNRSLSTGAFVWMIFTLSDG